MFVWSSTMQASFAFLHLIDLDVEKADFQKYVYQKHV